MQIDIKWYIYNIYTYIIHNIDIDMYICIYIYIYICIHDMNDTCIHTISYNLWIWDVYAGALQVPWPCHGLFETALRRWAARSESELTSYLESLRLAFEQKGRRHRVLVNWDQHVQRNADSWLFQSIHSLKDWSGQLQAPPRQKLWETEMWNLRRCENFSQCAEMMGRRRISNDAF